MELCIETAKEETVNMTFEEVYIKNRRLMMHTAMKILNNFADAEDCVSEAFLRLSKNFRKYSSLECPKMTSLLVIIVRNAALDKYRESRRVTLSEAPDEDAGAVSLDSYPFDSVISAIKGLRDEYRDVLMLRYVYGYTVNEISGLLKLSTENVYKRIQRSRKALARELEKGGGK